MPRAGTGPDFIEALARGLEVIAAFRAGLRHLEPRRGRRGRPAWPVRPPVGSCSRSPSSATCACRTAARASVARSRRGCSTSASAYVRSQGLWDVARPHMQALVAQHPTSRARWPSSTARTSSTSRAWPYPRSLACRCRSAPVSRPSRPRWARCCSPPSPAADLEAVLAQPTRSGLVPRWQPDRDERDAALREVRARGWALTDEQLTLGIRSVAAPLRDGDRPGDRRGERQHARGRDVGGAARRRAPPVAAGARRGRSAQTSPVSPPCRTRAWPSDRTSVRRAEEHMAGPLSGVLVADFSRVLAGPYATMLLADMGAEVVKVESPDRRRDAHVDSTRPRRRLDLLPRHQPGQAVGRTRPARRGRPGARP